MERYTGKDDKHGYGAEVLDILTPQDITDFGVDVAAMKTKKMSELSEDELDALVTAMNRREGFGASKKKAGLSAMDDVDLSQYTPGAQMTEADLPPNVRQAIEVKKMWDAKGDDDKIREARAKLRRAYSDIKQAGSAKVVYDKVLAEGYTDADLANPQFDVTALLQNFFTTKPEAVAASTQIRQYARANSDRTLYEGLIDEYGGSYDDLKKQYNIDAPVQEPPAAKPDEGKSDMGENFEWDGKRWIYKGQKPN